MQRHVGDVNILTIRYAIGSDMVTETVSFNRAFKTAKHMEMDQGHIDLDDLLSSQRYTIDISPLDSIRISKSELRSLLTQVPLVDYLRFVAYSIKT